MTSIRSRSPSPNPSIGSLTDLHTSRFIMYEGLVRDNYDLLLRKKEEEAGVPLYSISDKFSPISGDSLYFVKYDSEDNDSKGKWVSKTHLNNLCIQSPEVLSMAQRFDILWRGEKKTKGVTLDDIRKQRRVLYPCDSCHDMVTPVYRMLEDRLGLWISAVGEVRRTLRSEGLFFFNTGFQKPPNGDLRHSYLYAWFLFRTIISLQSAYADRRFFLVEYMAGRLFKNTADNSMINGFIWRGNRALKCMFPVGTDGNYFKPTQSKASIILFTTPSKHYLLSTSVIVIIPGSGTTPMRGLIITLLEY